MEAEAQVAVPSGEQPLPEKDLADSPFQPYLLVIFAVIVALVAVQNIWLRRRNEAASREPESRAER